jgi:hypothetical protein
VAEKFSVKSPVVPSAVADWVVPRKATDTVEPGVKAQVLVSEAVAGALEVDDAVTLMVVLDEQLVEMALVVGDVDPPVAAEAGRAVNNPDTPSTMIAPAIPILILTDASSSRGSGDRWHGNHTDPPGHFSQVTAWSRQSKALPTTPLAGRTFQVSGSSPS